MLKTIINCWSTINNQKQMIFKRFGEIVLCYFYLTNKCKISSAVLWVKIIKRIDFHIIFHLKCTIVLWVIKHRHSIWFTMLKQSGVRFFSFFAKGSCAFPLFWTIDLSKTRIQWPSSRVIWNLGQNVTVLTDGFPHTVTGDAKSMVNRV